jgi:hypothetical protein
MILPMNNLKNNRMMMIMITNKNNNYKYNNKSTILIKLYKQNHYKPLNNNKFKNLTNYNVNYC